jgi:phage terminase large subunit GpA-like protein
VEGLAEPTFATYAERLDRNREVLRPPRRLKVSEAAEAYVYIHQPGGFSGWYRNDSTPYLVEPMNTLQSREFDTVVLVAPAQSGKTQVGLNWLAYSIAADPADMLLVQTTRVTARDFSRRRVDRLHRYSPEVSDRLLPGKQDDNTFDKFYRAGNIFSIGWPSISELSGRPVPRCWATDYDRMPADVEDEGAVYGLLRQRIRSYLSRGMVLLESSPGGEIVSRTYIPSSAHEAPPTTGILAIYNQGDRRRWYWTDPSCGAAFEPVFELLTWDVDARDFQAAADSVHMACPHCGSLLAPGQKAELNRAGRWLIEGQSIVDGELVGEARRSNIASFWLQGPAAAFQSWQGLVLEWLQAQDEFERTGNTEPLKTTVQQSQGKPYRPPLPDGGRLPEELQARAEDLARGVVPQGARFLITAVDVQKKRFVVQVIGYGRELERWVVDRFEITKSKRQDGDGGFLPLDPGSYLEDWDTLRDVITKRYALAGDASRGLTPILTVCDSGGAEGVTANAYAFYRGLAKTGLHRRFMLVKGDGRMTAPRIRKSLPDHDRSDRAARAAGEVPIWLLNVNMIKDGIANDLAREAHGRGFVHLPAWLPASFFAELCVEDRTDKGWQNPSGERNEAFDLFGYAHAGAIRIGAERMNWDKPPPWADAWDRNPMQAELVPKPAEKTTAAAPRAPVTAIRRNWVTEW